MNPQINNTQYELFPIPYSEVDKTVLRNGIRFYTENVFNIPAPVVCKHYQNYKLLYWSAAYLIDQIQGSMGLIVRDGIAYNVIYAKDTTRGKILQASKQEPLKQYKLSFRQSKAEWNLNPSVIIADLEHTIL